MPKHLRELEEAAQTQATVTSDGGGWTEETVIGFILKWSTRYNGQYAHDDVRLALRTYSIDPAWLEEAEKASEELRKVEEHQ